MRFALVGVLVLVVLPCAARAEDQPLAWAAHRAVADYLSTGMVAGQLTADAVRAWRDPVRSRAVAKLACSVGVTVAATESIKRAVHRTRPDRSDRFSFWSEHTGLAAAATGWRWQISLPILGGVGYLRQAADKHYMTDVLAGAGMGLLSRWVCGALNGPIN